MAASIALVLSLVFTLLALFASPGSSMCIASSESSASTNGSISSLNAPPVSLSSLSFDSLSGTPTLFSLTSTTTAVTSNLGSSSSLTKVTMGTKPAPNMDLLSASSPNFLPSYVSITASPSLVFSSGTIIVQRNIMTSKTPDVSCTAEYVSVLPGLISRP